MIKKLTPEQNAQVLNRLNSGHLWVRADKYISLDIEKTQTDGEGGFHLFFRVQGEGESKITRYIEIYEHEGRYYIMNEPRKCGREKDMIRNRILAVINNDIEDVVDMVCSPDEQNHK